MNYTYCRINNVSKYDEDAVDYIGLLFDTLDERIYTAPEIHTLFPQGYYATPVVLRYPGGVFYPSPTRPLPPVPSHTLISTIPLTDLLDAATADSPLLCYCIGEHAYTIHPLEHYNKCLSFFKVTGCTTCPDVGTPCLVRAIDPPYTPPIRPNISSGYFFTLREPLAGHTYVPPHYTKKETFAKNLRPYWEHNLTPDNISDNQEAASTRAKRSAESRAFARTECARCLISTGCDTYRRRRCEGHYPAAGAIVKQCLPRLTAAFKASKWPKWQLWEIALNVGATGKHRRYNLTLTGLRLDGNNGIVPSVYRSRGAVRYTNITTYEEFATVFNLCTMRPASGGAPFSSLTRDTRAVFWLALTSYRARQSYGWGMSRHVAGIGITSNIAGSNTSVCVQWAGETSLHYTNTLRYIHDVASYMTPGYLEGVSQVQVPTAPVPTAPTP